MKFHKWYVNYTGERYLSIFNAFCTNTYNKYIDLQQYLLYILLTLQIQQRNEQVISSPIRRNVSDSTVDTSSEASSLVDMEAVMYGNNDSTMEDETAIEGNDPITMDQDSSLPPQGKATAATTTAADTVATPPPRSSAGAKKPRRRLFIVCFHLPVKVYKDVTTEKWHASWSESLISNTDNKSKYNRTWIGTVTCSSIQTDRDKEELTEVLREMDCIPLFLDKTTLASHYLGMCKQVLWPAFHNVDMLDLSTSKWSQQQPLLQTQNQVGEGDAGGGLHMIDSSTSIESNTTALPFSDWDQARLQVWWEAYVEVNRAFASIVGQFLLDSDPKKIDNTVWIHDYHLAMLPKLLADMEHERFQKRFTKMVFYLHIPFPTSQIFRELECGEQILEGMLHADVVGFHAFDHARHFLNAGKRIMGLNYESLVGGLVGMKFKGRVVLITMSNVSIEGDEVDASLQLPSVQEDTHELKNIRHPNRTIICGVDVAQRLSGIGLKFLAYERLLADYPSWHSKIVLVQKCLVPNNRQVDELVTLRELRFLVRRIRDAFGPHVIDYEEIRGSQLPMAKRLALWRASDVFVSTPVREGLNLLPLEFIYSHNKPASAGVAVVSEFSACSSVLNGALRVNPFDISMTASFLDKALSMSRQERDSRHLRDIEFISTMPSSKWTKNVLRDLEDIKQSSDGDDESNIVLESTGEPTLESIGSFLAKEYDSIFSYVNYDALKTAYNATNRRVIIVDFNGTLVVKEPPGKYLKKEILGTSGFKPPVAALQALHDLCADPCNTVFVVSGDAQETLEAAIGSIPGLYLAASNGACYSPPPKQQGDLRKWYSFDLGVDTDAVKQVALPVLSKYTARTNGSYIKLTHSSIGWSYYSSDPEWGAMQSSHLVLELEHVLAKFDVRFVTLKGIVEIVPRRLNKGLIVKKVLREVASRNGGDGVDFILCMGDDISDEKMFASVYSFISEIDEEYSNVLPSPSVAHLAENNEGLFFSKETPSLKWKNSKQPIYAFTVAVGKKPSHAALYVDDARDVANVLMSMTDASMNIVPHRNSWDMEEAEGTLFV